MAKTREEHVMQVMLQPKNFNFVLANTLPDLGLQLAGKPKAIDDQRESLRVNFGLASDRDADKVMDAVKDVLRQGVAAYVKQEVSEVPDDALPNVVILHLSALKMAREISIPRNLGLEFPN